MASKTGKPTGLTVNRKKNKLVVEWKIGDADYKDGQELYYVRHYLDHPSGAPSGLLKSYDVKVWADVKNSASKYVYSIKESDYFPHNTTRRLLAIDFAVRGNRKKYEKKGKKINPTWSDYAKKTFDINAPSKPSVSSSFNASEEITTRFTASAKDTDHAPYTRMVWESILVKNASSTDGSKYKWARGQMGWKTGTSKSLSHTETVTESGIAVTATTSYTRFFRAKSQGMGGESVWAYSYHVYGASAKPSAVSPKVSRLDGNVTLDIRVNTPQSASHPIDNSGIKVQYRMEKPDEGLALPSGDSWTDAGTRNNTAKKNSDYFHFDLGTRLADDNCLWYRIGSTHDDKTTWSDPYLRFIGYLPNPTITQIVPNFESHSVEFRANNASEITDSYLVGVCKVDGQDEAIIASSETGGGDKTFYGTIPDGATEDTTAFGVRAVVGTLSGSTVKPYSGKLVMDSRMTVWKDDQGRLPIPPSGVSAVKASVEETAEISWQWSWNDADAVQITWSDNPLAWESNEEPSEYTVTRLNAGHWYISGLESGVRWYFRLRFIKGDGDNAVYSAWSEMVSIDLRSAPNKPTLMLSEYVIPADATTTAYWAYVTTDGTPQRYAEICEAIVEEDSPIEYGETIAQTETAQHIDIDPKALGWADGEEHYLCVKVQSASGITSEGWSDPVMLKIAEKPVAVIADDSLETQSIEIHPQTYTGDMVQIDNADGVLEATSVRMSMTPVQDLHGYDKPWSGGNGVNKLQTTATSQTINGTTFTVNEDGSVRISGTPTTTTRIALTSQAFGSGVWAFYGEGFVSGVRFFCKKEASGTTTYPTVISEGSNTTQTLAEGDSISSLLLEVATSFSGTAITVKCEVAKDTMPTSWTPYSNICPISGRTECVTSVSGVNVWDEEWELGWWNYQTGVFTPSSSFFACKNKIPALPNTDYYWKCPTNVRELQYYDANGDPLGSRNSFAEGYMNTTFTTPANCYYLTFYFGGSYGNTYGNNISINYPSTDTSHHAYNGHTYTTALGRTVYGGTLDVVSGELVVDRAMVDLGTLNWQTTSTATADGSQCHYATVSGMATDTANTDMISDRFTLASGKYISQMVEGTMIRGSGNIYVATNAATISGQLVYPLATPQTYQLTPQAIALLTGDNNVWSDMEMTIRVADAVEQGDVLTRLPLELTVTGAGAGRTVVAIERTEPYDMDRPDETRRTGNESETVALTSQDGEASISIGTDSRLGYFDDGARYQIVAMVKDAYGQASEKVYKPFLVRWEHQAVIPNGEVEIDGLIAKLTPSAPSDVPSGWQMADGDHIDIYRLSADRPVLVYPNAEIGETYVDPYPAIGGGYRFVFVSKDGDYICTDEDGNQKAAWTDVESEFDYDRMILDFGGDRAELYYNVDEDDDWGKDFLATKYMSGRIVGDWNAGIEHTGDVNAVVITVIDDEVVSAMRRLAEYEGAVHVRTTSGASYDADVQVKRSRSHSHFGTRYSYSLSITRVDTGEYDGVPLSIYEEEVSE